MLYNLIEKKRGKETVVMTDSLPKVNDRLKTLRSSLRTKKVTFRVEKTEETDKYKKKPLNHRLSGGDAQVGPRKVKWG